LKKVFRILLSLQTLPLFHDGNSHGIFFLFLSNTSKTLHNEMASPCAAFEEHPLSSSFVQEREVKSENY